MRELTLLETGYLCGGLLLSLVLPLIMSFRGPQDPMKRKSCLMTVWTGQALLALAGFAIFASAKLAPYAAVVAVFSCSLCALVLLRQSGTQFKA